MPVSDQDAAGFVRLLGILGNNIETGNGQRAEISRLNEVIQQQQRVIESLQTPPAEPEKTTGARKKSA